MSDTLNTFSIVQLFCCLATVLSQSVPLNPCPNYFQYLSNGNTFIGRLILPVSLGRTAVEVKFSQRESIPPEDHGSTLSLQYDQETTIANIQKGQPTYYRVDFPFPNIPPKLTEISINNQLICRGNRYAPPRSNIALVHYLETSASTFTQNFEQNNPFSMRPTSAYGNAVQPNNLFTSPDIPSYYSRSPMVPPNSTPRSAYGTRPRLTPNSITQAPNIINQITRLSPDSLTQTSPQNNWSFKKCGQEGNIVGFRPFIAGGEILNRGQFPWLVAVFQKLGSTTTFRCGGSLVSTRTVITAAHCFKEFDITEVDALLHLGRYSLYNHTETGYELRDVAKVIIHPEYDREMYPDADIAIMHMNAPVVYTPYIQPICFWTESDDQSLISGVSAFVAGWGLDNIGNSVTDLPKVVTATIVDWNQCLKSGSLFMKLTSPRTICAGNLDGTGPCKGDSGGGLLIKRGDSWILRGIVSGGSVTRFQCNLHKYVVYCDLAKHRDWVFSNLL